MPVHHHAGSRQYILSLGLISKLLFWQPSPSFAKPCCSVCGPKWISFSFFTTRLKALSLALAWLMKLHHHGIFVYEGRHWWHGNPDEEGPSTLKMHDFVIVMLFDGLLSPRSWNRHFLLFCHNWHSSTEALVRKSFPRPKMERLVSFLFRYFM